MISIFPGTLYQFLEIMDMKFSRVPKSATRHLIPLTALLFYLPVQAEEPSVVESSVAEPPVAESSVAEASGGTRYVKPTAEVVVRRGQGNEYKIIGMVKDGDRVDFLEESGSYARIRFAGKEGWMLKRYLSAEPPLGERVASLEQERDQLQQDNLLATEQAQQASTELSRIQAELDIALEEHDRLVQEYQTLKQDTANVMQIKNDLERVTTENMQLQDELGVMGEENKELKKESAINWFLAGAGVFLVGILIGKLPGPSRKRKPSLL